MKIDLQQIPFPHETFGLVICNHMLERVDDPAAALREMHRVLNRVDGRFATPLFPRA